MAVSNNKPQKKISVHYMDDTTILTKQNRCFKVITELNQCEEVSEATIIYYFKHKVSGLVTGQVEEFYPSSKSYGQVEMFIFLVYILVIRSLVKNT